MASFDCGAHDKAHCLRVANLALKIAITETSSEDSSVPVVAVDVFLVYVAGLMHDVLDSKLLVDISRVKSTEDELCEMLLTFMSPEEIAKILVIIKSVGYKNLLKPTFHPQELSIEYRCVQVCIMLLR